MAHKAEIELKLELKNSDLRALAQNSLRPSAIGLAGWKTKSPPD
jgi:hypothetical protein